MRQVRRISVFLLLCSCLYSLSSCYNTKYLAEDEYLFKANEMEFVEEEQVEGKKKVEKELLRLSKLKPNDKFLRFFTFKLWVYNEIEHNEDGFIKRFFKEDHRFLGIPYASWIYSVLYQREDAGQKTRQWLQDNIGEPPVLLDSGLVNRSITNMENYLYNRGYLYPAISYETSIKNKLATVHYLVDVNHRYKIRKVIYDISDSLIQALVRETKSNSKLKEGNAFDIDFFKDERERIANKLLNNGYYRFNKEYVQFSVDSSKGSRQIDVRVQIKNPVGDSMHHVYYIGEIQLFPNYKDDFKLPAEALDTIYEKGVSIISYALNYKRNTLTKSILFDEGDKFSIDENRKTVKNFNALGAFKYVSMQYEERREDGRYILDCQIRLQPQKKQEVAVEVNANTNSNYQIGTALNFTYKNKNLFRNADLFLFNINSGIVTQFEQSETFINNLEISPEASLFIPKFLIPSWFWQPRGYNAKTVFRARYSYIKRIEFYTLHNTNFSFGYNWIANEKSGHIINPVDITLLLLRDTTSEFSNDLQQDPRLQRSFEQQIILGANYTYIFNDRNVSKDRHSFYFRSDIDIAGNVIQGVNSLFSSRNQGESFEIFGIPYTQYAKFAGDFRHYYTPNPKNSFVSRFNAGLIIPYGNSIREDETGELVGTVPYTKQFFSGGTNSIRAWRVRRLGPGSYNVEASDENADFQDQTGEIKLEANFEYRFDMFSILEGAVFLDMGNIWTLRKDPQREGAQFRLNRFYKEIAIGTGIGARLDFSFFIFRTDLGFRLYDPAQDESDRWLPGNPSKFWRDFGSNMVINIAIGYPF